MSRRFGLAAVGAVVVLLALVPLGRWERGRADRTQLDGIARTKALVGDPIASPRLAAYRLTWHADCLLYRFAANPFAVELCFDSQGRLVETIDRRTPSRTRIASIRFRPSLDRRPESPEALFDLFRSLGGIPEERTFSGSLPLGGSLPLPRQIEPGDTGPILARRRH